MNTPVLVQEHHAALIREIESVAKDANIPQAVLQKSMVGFCTSAEVEYVRKLRHHAAAGRYGLVLYGTRPTPPVLDRFSVMAAACLRNYISAKVMTVQDVVEALGESQMPSPSVLFIPNFCLGGKTGGRLAEWETPLLLSLLYNRQSEGLQTVVYVEAMPLLRQDYGPGFAQHFESEHFIKIDAGSKDSDNEEESA